MRIQYIENNYSRFRGPLWLASLQQCELVIPNAKNISKEEAIRKFKSFLKLCKWDKINLKNKIIQVY